MHNLTEEEIDALRRAETADEWDRICDEIKIARQGNYPPDWYQTVVIEDINPLVNKQITIHEINE